MQIEIEPQTLEWIKSQMALMVDPVKLKIFTQKDNCEYCGAIVDLSNRLAGLSQKIVVETCECGADDPLAKKYSIDKHPAILIHGKDEYKVRWFGLPIGFEFSVFIQDIVVASTGETKLDEEVKVILRALDRPVQIRVFTIPTCPKCPHMVRTAHDFAFFNKNITADAIEAHEFWDLAQKWHVFETPRTVINEQVELVGVIGEKELAEMLLNLT
jgi:glutaredoxin-like protein